MPVCTPHHTHEMSKPCEFTLYSAPTSVYTYVNLVISKFTLHLEQPDVMSHFIMQIGGVVVQFHPWFNFSFSLITIYDNEYVTKENKIEPRIKLNYNTGM